jgi:hypothetical protein
MKISGKDAITGEEVVLESSEIDKNFIDELLEQSFSDEQIKRTISALDISADAKSALYTLSSITVKAGKYVIKLGRKLIDLVAETFREYPNASFGLIFGAIIGFLITSIPFIGAILGPIVTPILMALGLAGGIFCDLQDKALERKVAEINAKFQVLKA